MKGFCSPGVVQFALACFFAGVLSSQLEISLCMVIVATGKTHRKYPNIFRNCAGVELLRSLAPRQCSLRKVAGPCLLKL